MNAGGATLSLARLIASVQAGGARLIDLQGGL